MTIDDRALRGLLQEAQDLHLDAMRAVEGTYPALRQVGEERRGQPVDAEEVDRFNLGRRALLSRMGLDARGLAGRALGYGGLASLLQGLVARPAAADRALDVQILQTASSLEQLAVATYDTVLTENVGGIADLPGTAAQVVRTFVSTTMLHHDEHNRAFQSQTRLLGGPEQTEPNRKFQLIADRRLSLIRGPVDVIELGAILEKAATDTYLLDLSLLEDSRSKELVAGVMGVEAQHLAGLRLVGSLLRANAPQLVKVPLGGDLGSLPGATGTVASPDALAAIGGAELVAEPTSGAVR